MAEGRTLGDPETVHYGLVPRTNRGIFSVNELPDLAERIQVALLNVLEERDIQVRGYPLRLPLDLLLVASANPEDYTNRGRIITPLKDRFGAEVRTHYPLRARRRARADRARRPLLLWDGRRSARRSCRTTCSRSSPGSPARCARRRRSTSAPGVSARFAIAAAETVAACAVRRAAVDRRGRRRSPGSPTCRRSSRPSRGKVEFDDAEEGREVEVLDAPAAPGDRRDVPGPAGRARPAPAAGAVRRAARPVETGELVPAAELLAQVGPVPGLAALLDRLGIERGRGVPGPGRGRAVEFALEGLHLNRRLAKDELPGPDGLRG